MGYDRIAYIRYHFSCGLDRKDACWLSFTPLTGLVCIFVQSPPKVKALQMGVRLCEAARADPCLGVWPWPTDHFLDGLDEGR